eukprot:TRINITY_DN8716_c0_g1_i4.p1 TRINITY_DN8716_c0_g1~~TRINITY_DN8716_c0_g1_i4.p1  ORF type:complete len:358 (-),score=84.01 TRINITY_DN8716_c0_g1_i4:115-1188(-)
METGILTKRPTQRFSSQAQMTMTFLGGEGTKSITPKLSAKLGSENLGDEPSSSQGNRTATARKTPETSSTRDMDFVTMEFNIPKTSARLAPTSDEAAPPSGSREVISKLKKAFESALRERERQLEETRVIAERQQEKLLRYKGQKRGLKAEIRELRNRLNERSDKHVADIREVQILVERYETDVQRLMATLQLLFAENERLKVENVALTVARAEQNGVTDRRFEALLERYEVEKSHLQQKYSNEKENRRGRAPPSTSNPSLGLLTLEGLKVHPKDMALATVDMNRGISSKLGKSHQRHSSDAGKYILPGDLPAPPNLSQASLVPNDPATCPTEDGSGYDVEKLASKYKEIKSRYALS